MSQTDARAARAELERLLATDAPVIAPLLPPGFADAAERYVELLLAANARLNLTRVVAPAEVARLHLLDSLAALPLMGEAPLSRAADIGSGGGVPGIVLALARFDVRWTLIESIRKKADTLRSFVDALSLANVDVLAERVELVGRDSAHRERVELVTARACAALPVLAEYSLPLLSVDGRLLAWKGRMSNEELAAGSAASSRLGGGKPEVRLSGVETLGEHRFVVVPKVEPTPDRYPRRPGEPSRRPLV